MDKLSPAERMSMLGKQSESEREAEISVKKEEKDLDSKDSL